MKLIEFFSESIFIFQLILYILPTNLPQVEWNVSIFPGHLLLFL